MEGFDSKAPSQGLGDTIAKITHATGLDVVADKVAKAMGKEDCGCNRRREKLNNLVPYNKISNIDEYRESLKNSSSSFILPTTILINKNLSIQLNDKLVKYAKGEKVYVTKDHPITQSLEYFLKIGAVEVVDKI
jgi:hypothetical protein